MSGRLKILLGLLAALLLAALASGYTLLHTEAGARWLLARTTAALDGRLVVTNVSGDLGSGLTLRGVRYGDPSVELQLDQARLRVTTAWWPLGVEVHALEAGPGQIALTGGGADEDAPAGDGDFRLPAMLIVHSADLRDIELRDPEGRLLDVHRLAFSGRARESLRIERLHLETSAGSLALTGRAALQPPYRVDIESSGAVNVEGTPLEWGMTLDGDARRLEVEATTRAPEARLAGTLTDLLDAPRAQLRLTAERAGWPFRSESPQWVAHQLHAELAGALDAWTLDARARIDLPGASGTQTTLTASGSSQRVDDLHLVLDGADQQLDARGSLAWQDGLELITDVRAERFDPSAFWSGWPDDRVLHGEARGSLTPGHVQVDTLVLREHGADTEVLASGAVSLQEDRVELDARWTGLDWTLDNGTTLASDAGQAQARGRLDDWTLSADGHLAVADYPEGEVSLSARGDRDAVTLDALDVLTLGGRVSGNGRYDWSQHTWTADLVAEALQPAALWAELGGPVDAAVVAHGRGEPFLLEAEITGGRLAWREQLVSIDGGVSLSGERWRFDALEARTPEDRLWLDGNPDAPEGLAVELDVQALGRWWPEARGRLQARGTVRGRPPLPGFDGEVSGDSLAWEGYAVDSLQLRGLADARRGPEQFELQAEGITWPDGRLTRAVALYAPAGAGEHALDLVLERPGEHLEARLVGAWQATPPALESGWRGRLDALRLEFEDQPLLELQAPAGLAFSTSLAHLDRACLRAAGTGEACVEGDWDAGGGTRLRASLSDLPLGTVSEALGSPWRLSQQASGSLAVRLDEAGLVDVDARLGLSEGAISRADVTAAPLRTGPGELRLLMAQREVLRADLSLPLVDVGELHGQAAVTDIAAGIASPITGYLQVDIADLGFVANLSPIVDRSAGTLRARVEYAGTVAEPRLSGEVALHDGLLEYQPTGLLITGLEVDGRFTPDTPAELQGRFQAGEGEGTVTLRMGLADFVPDRVRLDVRGERLLLTDLPEARLEASPDLQITWVPGSVELGGALHVPHARFSPRASPVDVVYESSDVEVVAGSLPETESAAGDTALRGTLALSFGDDVRVDVGDAEAKVTGEMDLRWVEGQATPRADGRLLLSGKYQAYGQLLDIRDGEIRFPNVPADNPRLSITAVRDIFGDPLVDTAGLRITGTARVPRVTLFTQPETTEEKALAYIITGSDFDHSGGVGRLNVGTYVLPRLFVSYGIGLFDTGNVLSARYDFNERWGVKASSGEAESGVDLSYTKDQ